MGLLCCGRNAAPPTPPAMHSPAKIPKLIRRRSAPRPRASKQDIEIFYREGKELFRAEQEEIERSRLRKIWRQERQEVLYDEDAADIASILNPISLAKPLSPLTEGSSLLEYSQNVRRYITLRDALNRVSAKHITGDSLLKVVPEVLCIMEKMKGFHMRISPQIFLLVVIHGI